MAENTGGGGTPVELLPSAVAAVAWSAALAKAEIEAGAEEGEVLPCVALLGLRLDGCCCCCCCCCKRSRKALGVSGSAEEVGSGRVISITAVQREWAMGGWQEPRRRIYGAKEARVPSRSYAAALHAMYQMLGITPPGLQQLRHEQICRSKAAQRQHCQCSLDAAKR
eukprot:1144704-Pelagomonas_calceolata.AAC.4